MPASLPEFPSVTLEVVEDITAGSRCDQGFLRIRRQRLRARYPSGALSDPFIYDHVERTALDAVVMAAHFLDSKGQRCVYLRAALRPPVALRPLDVRPVPERSSLGYLWELPAGLVEPDERSARGLRECAARELAEELGFHLRPDDMIALGPSSFPAPAVLGERHFYFECTVNPDSRQAPGGDGSILERHAAIVAIALQDALDLVRRGEIEDAKTEIALRRLVEKAT
jgi:ADP-ribose pyrophosphatase